MNSLPVLAIVCLTGLPLEAAGVAAPGQGGQGAPAPIPMPSRHQRHLYLKAEFSALDANMDRRISKTEFTKHAKAAIDQARRIAKKHRYEPHMVSQLVISRIPSAKKPAFAHIDTNGDGQIAFHKEYLRFSTHQFGRFSKWDADENGKVTQPEYVKGRHAEHKASFVGDEPVVLATRKHQNRWKLEFGLRNRDGNDNVTWAEMMAFENLTTFSGLSETRGGDAYFISLDANFDGTVTRTEFLANARQSGNAKFLKLEQDVFRIRDLNGDKKLSFLEYLHTGENTARSFVTYDKDRDGVIRFSDVKGIQWVAGKSEKRDRCYFDRLDADRDDKVTWKEFRSITARGIAFGAIDHINIDNTISRKEWDAIEREYLAGQKGKRLPPHNASGYAQHWFSGIFDLITFTDLDANKDGKVSWREFRTFAN